MAITYGFYNSVNHDRKYNAKQFSSMFDGIINDGVFQSIGAALMVTANSGLTVNVGLGRAWFKSTWTDNDALFPVTLAQAEVVFNRIDAVVLEVSSAVATRANTIKVIKGTPASSPVPPSLVKGAEVNQYPLAHIYVTKQATTITQANITNKVGTSDCPFITGILQTMSIDAIIAQWDTEFSEWNDASRAEFDTWNATNQADFLEWVMYIKTVFNDDPAGGLQNEIDELKADVLVLETATGTLTTDLGVLTASTEALKQTAPVLTAGASSAFTVTIPGLVLTDGTTFKLKLHAPTSNGATLNVNASGAYPILSAKGKAISAGFIEGSYLTMVFNGLSFILQGDGSDDSTSKRKEDFWKGIMTNSLNVRGW